MATSLVAECSKLAERPMLVTALDIYKAFDQVQRPILYVLLFKAGFPMGALRAYAVLMEHLQVHNALAAGLGQQHGRPCAIPQG